MLFLRTVELARIGDELVDEDDARAAAVKELAELLRARRNALLVRLLHDIIDRQIADQVPT